MDFNEIGEGATVYLPVANPGALLYLGDAHAEQGDGELNGNALETSMDVEFSVDVIQGTHLFDRRIEIRRTSLRWAWQIGTNVGDRRWITPQNRRDQLGGRTALEGPPPVAISWSTTPREKMSVR
jgi:hypothetical protein